MFKLYSIASLILVTLLIGCVNSATNSKGGQSNGTQTSTIPAKEAMYNNFNAFVDKFSSDSTFQLSRTKFPLKIKWYDIDNDKDSLIYKERSSFEMMDFRKKKSTGQYDQWEQLIIVDKNNTSATIEIRGIDNGIRVYYIFYKINGAWMFIEIDDSST